MKGDRVVARIGPTKDELANMKPEDLPRHGFRPRDPRLTSPLLTCVICGTSVKPDYDVCIRCERQLEGPYAIPIEEELLDGENNDKILRFDQESA